VKERPVVTAVTTPEELREVFRASRSGVLRCVLEPAMSREDLIGLVERHQGEDHHFPLLQLMVTHPSVDEGVLNLLLDRADDAGVEGAVATSGRASAAVLGRHASVREHAALALLRLELEGAPPERFEAILDGHPGEEGIDLGVRAMLAAHPRTPRRVLERLAQDDVDVVQQAAAGRLS
jgi:hypothetical protein